MTLSQQIFTVGLCALATMLTRFLPFLLFSGTKPTPRYVAYLGSALPAALTAELTAIPATIINAVFTVIGIAVLYIPVKGAYRRVMK